MINIEKEFYKAINEKFSDCDSVAYHLAEMGTITTAKMEQYLIKKEFRELKSKGGKTFTIYEDLAEKFCKTLHGIQYVIEKT